MPHGRRPSSGRPPRRPVDDVSDWGQPRKSGNRPRGPSPPAVLRRSKTAKSSSRQDGRRDREPQEPYYDYYDDEQSETEPGPPHLPTPSECSALPREEQQWNAYEWSAGEARHSRYGATRQRPSSSRRPPADNDDTLSELRKREGFVPPPVQMPPGWDDSNDEEEHAEKELAEERAKTAKARKAPRRAAEHQRAPEDEQDEQDKATRRKAKKAINREDSSRRRDRRRRSSVHEQPKPLRRSSTYPEQPRRRYTPDYDAYDDGGQEEAESEYDDESDDDEARDRGTYRVDPSRYPGRPTSYHPRHGLGGVYVPGSLPTETAYDLPFRHAPPPPKHAFLEPPFGYGPGPSQPHVPLPRVPRNCPPEQPFIQQSHTFPGDGVSPMPYPPSRNPRNPTPSARQPIFVGYDADGTPLYR
ncbi:hypothetical protein JCM10212_004688 [Sporobolomyces blumeae]